MHTQPASLVEEVLLKPDKQVIEELPRNGSTIPLNSTSIILLANRPGRSMCVQDHLSAAFGQLPHRAAADVAKFFTQLMHCADNSCISLSTPATAIMTAPQLSLKIKFSWG